jgi:hypothetical protein
MASIDSENDIIREIRDIKQNMKSLSTRLDELTYDYVKMSAQSTEYIDGIFSTLHRYLTDTYHISESDSAEILHSIREGMTMGPISHTMSRITKYDTRVHYDSILYEWNGKRYMYVRADENSDNYYSGCDSYNGISVNELELESFEKYNWWKTDESIKKTVEWYNAIDLLERLIKKSKSHNNILDDLKSLPPELRLFRIMFDMQGRLHYLIKDNESIKSVYECVPCAAYYD